MASAAAAVTSGPNGGPATADVGGTRTDMEEHLSSYGKGEATPGKSHRHPDRFRIRSTDPRQECRRIILIPQSTATVSGWSRNQEGCQIYSAHSPLARKLGNFVALSGAELKVLDGLHRRRRNFVAGRDLVYQGQSRAAAYILADGWVCSYKLLPDGTRQIVDFQIPGDFLGLRSVLFRTADHNIEPVTAVEASEVLESDLLRAFSDTPRLATAVLWAASRDEAMVVEHLVGIGRRDALERMAHFLLELSARLTLVGRGTRTQFECPITQYHLADALGLSAVHVNRVLRELREQGLLTFQKGQVTVHDFDRLVELAEFDVGYLDHDGPLLR